MMLRSVPPAHSLAQQAKPTFGSKILVYSSYPNGAPVLDLNEDQVETILHTAFPGLAISKNDYVYGRTHWHDKLVGTIVYPLLESDSRDVDSVLNDPNLKDYEKDLRVNNMLPKVMAHDLGGYAVYDLSRAEFIQNEDDVKQQVAQAPQNPDVLDANDPSELTSVSPATAHRCRTWQPLSYGAKATCFDVTEALSVSTALSLT